MSVSADGRAAPLVVEKMCRKSYVSVGTEDGQLLSFATYDNLRFNLNWLNLLYYELECR